MHELVISRGRTGYLALSSYDEHYDAALMLAIGISEKTTIIDNRRDISLM